MIFDEVDLFCSDGGEVLRMSRKDPALHKSYLLRALLGLDVDSVVAKYYGRGSAGEPFYSMNIGKREVVLRVVINPNYQTGETVESLRTFVMKRVASTRTGTLALRFKFEDEVKAQISGFVTKLETAMSNNVPELQITLDCSRDPVLRSPNDVTVDTGLFPASSISVTDDESTAPHGFRAAFTCTSAQPKLIISDTLPHEWAFEVSGIIGASTGFSVGDIIYLSSEDNNRYIYFNRGSVTTYLANKVKPRSIWPILFPGANTFTLSAGFTCTSLAYKTAYWGV